MRFLRCLFLILGFSLSMIVIMLVIMRRAPPIVMIAYEALVEDGRGNTNIVVAWEDGTHPRIMNHEDGYTYASPSWSPDGGSLVYQRMLVNSSLKIMIHPLRASFAERLLPGETFFDLHADSSPDGKQLLLIRGTPGKQLCIITLNQTLTCIYEVSERDYISQARWSPDGEWIAFTRRTNLGFALYRIRPNGRNLERLYYRPTFRISTLAWSPDSSSLLFTSERSQTVSIYHIALATRRITRLYSDDVSTLERSNWLAWSPDMTQIFFVRSQKLFVMDADGGDVRRLMGSALALIGATPDSLYVLTYMGRVRRFYFDDLEENQIGRLNQFNPYGTFALSPPVDLPFHSIPLLLLVFLFSGVLIRGWR